MNPEQTRRIDNLFSTPQPPRLIVSRHPATVLYLRETLGWLAPACTECGESLPLPFEQWTECSAVGRHRDVGGVIAFASVTPEQVRGAVVAGNLPLHLAAEAAEVIAVEFTGDPPRGAEYGRAEMEAAGVRLTRYRVQAIA